MHFFSRDTQRRLHSLKMEIRRFEKNKYLKENILFQSSFIAAYRADWWHIEGKKSQSGNSFKIFLSFPKLWEQSQSENRRLRLENNALKLELQTTKNQLELAVQVDHQLEFNQNNPQPSPGLGSELRVWQSERGEAGDGEENWGAGG